MNHTENKYTHVNISTRIQYAYMEAILCFTGIIKDNNASGVQRAVKLSSAYGRIHGVWESTS